MRTAAKERALGVTDEEKRIGDLLAAPFDPNEVKFKPAVVSGARALALAYVDARVVQDRLDDVLGVVGWQDSYKVLDDGTVMCRLKCRIGGRWISKTDVGGESEQGDGGDRRKASFSDALKRTAVKFGVGRYLYRLPQTWVDYDSHKKQITSPPKLPAWALPASQDKAPTAKPAPAPAKQPPADPPSQVRPPSRPEPARAVERPQPAAAKGNGGDLHARISGYEAKLVKAGVCSRGDLVKTVSRAGVLEDLPADLAKWGEDGVRLAADVVKRFEQARACPPDGAGLLDRLHELEGEGLAAEGYWVGLLEQYQRERHLSPGATAWTGEQVAGFWHEVAADVNRLIMAAEAEQDDAARETARLVGQGG